MTKVILALRGADLGERLLRPSLREQLAGVGATAVQVNLDDADVAPALRFDPGRPVTALVSVWTGADAESAVGTVAEFAGGSELRAYRVTERVRLDPAPVPNGVRSDVFAQVALLRKPASMTWESYLQDWMVRHTPIAIRTQNTSAYVQNTVEDVLTPEAPEVPEVPEIPETPEVSAIVEEHFPMAALTDPHAFYGSGGDDAELQRRSDELMASVARFGGDQGLDLVPTSRYFWAL